jgi:hypothetical protein
MLIGIGISGKIASGKTTVRRYLETKYGFFGIAFADAIKKLARYQNVDHVERKLIVRIMADKLLPSKPEARPEFVKEVLEAFERFPTLNPDEKNRPLLQYLGTEIGRKYDYDMWLNYTLSQCKNYDRVVVDDVRFSNEADRLKETGFHLWRKQISPEIQKKRILELYGESQLSRLNHPSETNLDNKLYLFDTILAEELSLEEMYDKIDLMMSIYGVKEIHNA